MAGLLGEPLAQAGIFLPAGSSGPARRRRPGPGSQRRLYFSMSSVNSLIACAVSVGRVSAMAVM